MNTTSAPILITGVGKRIGLALARHIIASGHDVIGTYRSERPALQELRETGVKLIQVDLFDDQSIRSLMEQVLTQNKELRAIVHNASDWLPDNSGLSHAETFQKMMQVHAGAPYQINMALSELLENNQNGADIIHITDYIVETGSAKHIAYSASKAALQNMTLSFAQLLSPNIKVNAIAPSLIMFNPQDSDDYKVKTLDKSLLKIEPGEQVVVDAVDYILQNDYMTGRTLQLDGGRHLRR
ncbi:MAG: dihydromonapterin reductase [Motiliproteus sp.]|nr:dihydromonapterin reductase [Motiliproteus sp.]MCW9053775.1 dihydromonapterin reductase [Motiliproteus sp.]